MMARLVMVATVVIGMAGCLQSSLARCGDQLCPLDSQCVAERCVPAEAVAACAGLLDGAACATSQISDGACGGGVCSLAGCGTGVVEAGERCDDGNQVGGDGCSERCDSVEVCGDGVINGGEGCDCGIDPGALVAPCVAVNSNTDPRAACRADCTLRSCGNHIVEGFEQCEPGEPIAQTCEQVGFYQGTLGCTAFCRFDRSGCSGRCGDGVVDPFEQCDGADLDGRSCATLGFYDGNLGCNSACRFEGCSRRCGDGTLDAEEVCDSTVIPTCVALGFYDAPGVAACTGACTALPGSCERCGDGVWQPEFGEDCDGGTHGVTCADFGLPSSNFGLVCGFGCRWNFRDCDSCGNGICDEPIDSCPGDCCCFYSPPPNSFCSPIPPEGC